MAGRLWTYASHPNVGLPLSTQLAYLAFNTSLGSNPARRLIKSGVDHHAPPGHMCGAISPYQGTGSVSSL